MRNDGYNYIKDKDFPDSGKPIWIETDKGCGIGFYKDNKWFWNRRIAGKIFQTIIGKVICWKYLEENKNQGEENEDR